MGITKKQQAKIIEDCVKSGLLFDSAQRTWYDSDNKSNQSELSFQSLPPLMRNKKPSTYRYAWKTYQGHRKLAGWNYLDRKFRKNY